jgi:uncharacterized protein YndB with AHSA1/START domain
MERTTERLELRRELAIAASPETVWQYLVDPEKALLWWGQSIRFDARPGGEFRVDVIPGHVAAGEFVELDPPRRLVYTWGWEAGGDGKTVVPPGSSTVEIELVPDGEGTTLKFVHRDLPTADSVASHGHGWDHYLSRLAVAASGGDPGPDPWLSGME